MSDLKPCRHIVKEGSREHVLWWDSNGTHCSEPNCEVNTRTQREPDGMMRQHQRPDGEWVERGDLFWSSFDQIPCGDGFRLVPVYIGTPGPQPAEEVTHVACYVCGHPRLRETAEMECGAQPEATEDAEKLIQAFDDAPQGDEAAIHIAGQALADYIRDRLAITQPSEAPNDALQRRGDVWMEEAIRFRDALEDIVVSIEDQDGTRGHYEKVRDTLAIIRATLTESPSTPQVSLAELDMRDRHGHPEEPDGQT